MSLSNFVQEMEAITSNIKELNDERDQTVAALEAKIQTLTAENAKMKEEMKNMIHKGSFKTDDDLKTENAKMKEKNEELEAHVTALAL